MVEGRAYPVEERTSGEGVPITATSSGVWDSEICYYPWGTERYTYSSTPTTFSNDKTKSVLLSVTDPNNATTSATYDEYGRILTIVRPGDDSNNPTARMSYHNAGTPFLGHPFWTEAQQRIVGTTYFTLRKYYSGLGQLLQTQVVGAVIGTSTKDILTDTFYDTGGRVYQQTVPYEATTGENYHIRNTGAAFTETLYDILGRATEITATDLATTGYAYTDGYASSVPYLDTTVTNPRGNATTTRSDAWGRVTKVTPAIAPYVSYTYDGADRLLSVVRGGATTTLTYDIGGRKLSMNDPDMGLWRYTYDALGKLVTQTDAKGCITTLAYDTLNRPSGKTYSGACSGTAVSYTYDFDTNGKGRRTGMTDGSGSTSWTYDSRGRMTEESKAITGSGIFKTQWGYNSADLLSWMKYPGNNSSGVGEQVNFTYLPQMLLDSVIGLITYVQHTEYNAAGLVDLRKLGADVLRTDYVYYTWDTQGGRLQYLKTGTPSNSTSMQNFTYTYDENGDVKTILDAKNSNQKQCFLYDALDRLTRGTTQLSDPFCQATHAGNGQYDESYAYNASTGNLSSKAGANYTYGDTNHDHAVTQMGTNTYGYDANGNQTSRNVGGSNYTLSYDAENHLTGMTGGGVSATFAYDGDGNRVKGMNGSVTTGYVGNYAEWVVDGNTQTLVTYYYAGGTRVAMRSGSSDPLWLLGDHLGSTSKVVYYDGLTEHSQQLYKPWGEKRYPTGAPTLPTTFRYTGQRSETGLGPSGGEGLMYYGARWYDSSAGRFISADTIVPGAGNPQAYDRYAYVLNNPMKYIDPTGYHYCDSKYAAEDACNWYNKANPPDKKCRADKACYQAYLTYNELIFQLGRIPTVDEILYMTAQTEGYINKDSEYHGSGTYENNFVAGLARNYYQPYRACERGSWTCTESKLYKFMSGYQVWFGGSQTPYQRAIHLKYDGVYNDTYRADLEVVTSNITNIKYATFQGWLSGMWNGKPWQWHNWTRPPDDGEALGWIYLPTSYGNYFWIMTADQTTQFHNEIDK